MRRVANLKGGIQLANASRYGLGSAVFAWSRRRARAAARELRSGMTAINSVIAFAMVPALPFGGVGESGFGRIHGADGLREFTRAKAIARQWMKPPMNLTSFGRTDADLRRTVGADQAAARPARALRRQGPRVGGSRGPWGRGVGGSAAPGPRGGRLPRPQGGVGIGGQLLPGRGGSRPAVADRERSRTGPIGPRDPSAPRVAGYHHWLADEASREGL